MDDDQQFCLRWNNHQSTLVSVFDTLLEKGMHVDCTLAAEGQTLKAHKVVLSACSPYFENVLSQQFDKHPIIILKDVKYAELRAMMDYMYRGEVNISQDQLAALLKAAESLQIKGLSDNKPSRPPSRPAPAPPTPAAAPAAPPAAIAVAPRAPDTLPQMRDGSVDSREGSLSPTRRRKKPRRLSIEAAVPAAAAPPAPAHSPPEPLCKEEGARDGVEDLTLDDEHDEPNIAHNDVVRNFQWHMERSQDEIMNSSDGVRDSQELSGALLTLLSAQRLAAAFNNNVAAEPKDEPELEYDDTDDIVLPEEDAWAPGAAGAGAGGAGAGGRARGGSSSDDASRQFECRHCGKRYRWKSTLRRHENVECGGKPPAHQCPYCSYRAKQRGNLGVHVRKHHHAQWLLFAGARARRPRKQPV
ncbi:longitudinals lacking protein isoform X1 [Plutella xylostella]|uniref:longitudinals lacking protein isoform X1 n=1 Tax=Plutella xylostella TaxID=51655 RepID=UPI0020331108|nr:longitudinals lacking protein isoform X1 [Plutella xylostella]XP_048487681.1 longitudinals lacking protein isoform X1 [Plutella xylostella]